MNAELKNMHVLVAGATGYLGGFILKELTDRNISFKAIARSPQKLQDLNTDQIIKAEVTWAETLKGICKGVDVVISTMGITRQKNGLTYWTRRLTISLLRTFTSSKTYGPIEFFMTAMAMDNVAPRYGTHRLYSYFQKEVEKQNS